MRGHRAMANWTSDELDKIGGADELEIVTLRRDGTQRKPVTIWVVRHGDGLYVRSGYGDRAAWYRGTQARRDGHIKAGGIEKDVRFENAAGPALNDASDAPTGANTSTMAPNGSIQWSVRRRGPRRSSWCPAELPKPDRSKAGPKSEAYSAIRTRSRRNALRFRSTSRAWP